MIGIFKDRVRKEPTGTGPLGTPKCENVKVLYLGQRRSFGGKRIPVRNLLCEVLVPDWLFWLLCMQINFLKTWWLNTTIIIHGSGSDWWFGFRIAHKPGLQKAWLELEDPLPRWLAHMPRILVLLILSSPHGSLQRVAWASSQHGSLLFQDSTVEAAAKPFKI